MTLLDVRVTLHEDLNSEIKMSDQAGKPARQNLYKNKGKDQEVRE